MVSHPSLTHRGGLPFVGVVVDRAGEVISIFGVNRVEETGDPRAHAEIEAMRDVIASRGSEALVGALLLATGEPCGLCYRFAISSGIGAIYVATDRYEVAHHGFDYRHSYRALDISDATREKLFHPLPVPGSAEPFRRYRRIHRPPHPGSEFVPTRAHTTYRKEPS